MTTEFVDAEVITVGLSSDAEPDVTWGAGGIDDFGWASSDGRLMLKRLHREGALTAYQADQLDRAWPALPRWDADPYFRTVRDHTQAVIEQAAARELA